MRPPRTPRPLGRLPLVALTAAACSASSPPMHTARLPDGRTVEIVRAERGAARLVPLSDRGVTAVAPRASRYLWPPIIDSHVHLAYWDAAADLATHGVLLAVDLAAPLADLEALHRAPIDVRYSGPMLTRPGGYPLNSWGQDGFGIGCDSSECVSGAVADLAKHGASVIKVALGPDGLSPALLEAAVAAAHAAGLPVAAHALTDAEASAAVRAGCEILAHTPLEPLRAATVQAWRGRAVISTLAAFGGSAAAVDNLRRLRAAGAVILYGTDLGNLRAGAPSGEEIELLRRAGLDDAAILDAMTTAPARIWRTAPAAATPRPWLLLAGDPRRDLGFLLAPVGVVRAPAPEADAARAPGPP